MPRFILDTEEMRKAIEGQSKAAAQETIMQALREAINGKPTLPWLEPEKSSLKACPKAYSELFEVFWKSYPRKTGKGAAWKAFWTASAHVGSQNKLLELCLDALEWQLESEEHLNREGQYIPHAQTWLNQRRWEDENPEGETGNEDDYFTDMNGVRRRK